MPVVFFAVPSLLTERVLVRVHWDLVGYGTGMIALAGYVAEAGAKAKAARRWLGLGALAVAGLLNAALFAGGIWPALPVGLGLRPPGVRTLGWQALAAKVRDLEASRWEESRFILTDSFTSALCLGYQRRSREGIYTILSSRDARYGLTEQLKAWRMDEERFLVERLGHEAIYIHEFRHPHAPRAKDQPRRVFRYFEQIEPLAEVRVAIGDRVLRRFGLYRAHQMLLPP